MKLKIEIEMNNAAFQDNDGEIVGILKEIEQEIEANDLKGETYTDFKVFDSNGNAIGFVTFED